jgi:rhodanese-related sulfurtransferase
VIKGAILIVVLTLSAAAATHFLHPRAPIWYLVDETLDPDEVSLAEIEKRWHGDVLWVDARMREQFDKGHIPGAILLNEYERDTLLLEHLDKLQDNKKPIVIYCDGLACHASRKMREYLTGNMAIMDVWVLKGGWPAWQAGQKR